jgi:hypothetical protein
MKKLKILSWGSNPTTNGGGEAGFIYRHSSIFVSVGTLRTGGDTQPKNQKNVNFCIFGRRVWAHVKKWSDYLKKRTSPPLRAPFFQFLKMKIEFLPRTTLTIIK